MKKSIEKCAAIIVNNNKILLTRKLGTDIYISPGGKLNQNESHSECIYREIQEELSSQVIDLQFIATFTGTAQFENVEIVMHTYIVKIENNPTASSEIDAIIWFDYRNINSSIKVGSMIVDHVIPFLVNNENTIR